jgi:D-aminoacyl-tRNA deacylase
MRILLQRVRYARVRVNGEITGEIERGLLALVGIAQTDTEAELDQLLKKTVQLRIFEDEQGKMNLSVQDLSLSVLVVSQFTLYGDARKGNRPSYASAASPEIAESMYNAFVEKLRQALGEGKVATGIFRAMMEVELLNEGPVTIMLEA